MLIRPVYRPRMPSLAKGLVGWYPFDDSSAYDFSGDNITGTIHGGVTPAGGMAQGIQGRARLALLFDGSTGYIDLGSSSLLNFTSAVSIFAWVNCTLANANNQITIRNNSNSNFLGMYIANDGTVQVQSDAAGGLNSAAGTITANKWFHIGFTVDPGLSKRILYVNGKLNTSDSNTGLNSVSANNSIGKDAVNGRFFPGYIDDVRFYNRALSAGEVLALYAEAFQPLIDIETLALMQAPQGGAAFQSAWAARVSPVIGSGVY